MWRTRVIPKTNEASIGRNGKTLWIHRVYMSSDILKFLTVVIKKDLE